MMISPEAFVDQYKESSYSELREVRDELLDYIKAFEEERIPKSEWCIDPAPDVRYQLYLEYVGLICKLISEAYNREVVWTDFDDDDE